MKKPNLIMIVVMLTLIAAVALCALFIPQNRTLQEDAPAILPTQTADAAGQPTAAPTAETVQPTETPSVSAYLVVTVQGVLYEPLPLAGEGSFTIKQDENTTNTIHVTPDSICMEHSTCDNQDCVDQGTVSLENMSSRVLGNMIICLPNEVVLELYTPETLLSTFGTIP